MIMCSVAAGWMKTAGDYGARHECQTRSMARNRASLAIPQRIAALPTTAGFRDCPAARRSDIGCAQRPKGEDEWPICRD
jgi:hypothetical protein